jgi:beta-glucanase (GH16 family)
MITKKILILIFICVGFIAKSQTPSEDPNHYILDTEDNFNFFNYNLWGSKTPNNTWGLETYDASKVTASGGVLTLECEKVGNNYISGGIETVSTKAFSYGYFEIESKLPLSGIRGPWGGFWMHTGEGGWDEIDVLEPNGCDCELGTQFHSGVFATHGGTTRSYAKIYDGFPNLSNNYNKYALIWTPKYVQVLVNDEILYEIVDPLYVPSHPMFVFLTFQIDPWGCAPNMSTFPTKYWRFKHFKYYRLKTDCSNGITQNNFNFSNHDYKVQKFYSLSNSTIPNNSNIVLRATDYIELKGIFTVPLGSTFTAITHCNTCPN